MASDHPNTDQALSNDEEDSAGLASIRIPDLVELVEAAQWFVTRRNTNGRLLTPELCRRPPVDSFLFFLYYTIVPPAISTSIPQNPLA